MMNQRKINFNAGPAVLPQKVLEEVSVAINEYGNSGMSVLELPHRGKDFLSIIEESKALVKELCDIKDDYEVLWLQGGGRLQFCMIPMNLLRTGDTAGYIDSGHWATDAITYSRYYGNTEILASSKSINYSRLPDWPVIPDHLRYLHITTNNTIYGTQYHTVPSTHVPLVADMSSDIFGCNRDYNQYALFYAAAQKNLGTPGVALTVVRKDLLDSITNDLPPMLSYKAQAKEKSILNTANVSGVYIALLMLRWTKKMGIANIAAANARKAEKLYAAIDNNHLFKAHVQEHTHRSNMNICFTAMDANIEQAFLRLCTEHNIIGIEGHRSIGGFRVSSYNAVDEKDVALLAELIGNFRIKD